MEPVDTLSVDTSIIPEKKLYIDEADLWVTKRTEPAVRCMMLYLVLLRFEPCAKALQGAQKLLFTEFEEELTDIKGLFFQAVNEFSRSVVGRRITSEQAIFVLKNATKKMPEYQIKVDDAMRWNYDSSADKILRDNWVHDGWANDPSAITKPIRDLAVGEVLMKWIGVDIVGGLWRTPEFFDWLYPEMHNAFKVLLSTQKRRAEQTLRKLARQDVRARGFYHRKEETLIKCANYWFKYRVMYESYEEISPVSSNTGQFMTFDSFSEKIISPIDIAVGFIPKRGRRPYLTNYNKILGE